MRVLGAMTFLETHGANDMTMLAGRKRGLCESVLCSKRKGKNECEGNQYRFMRKGPSNSMDPTPNIQFFEKIGYTKDEMVALMGAHSIGGVNPCTGSGAFNKDP